MTGLQKHQHTEKQTNANIRQVGMCILNSYGSEENILSVLIVVI